MVKLMASIIFKISKLITILLFLSSCGFFSRIMDNDSPDIKKRSTEVTAKSCIAEDHAYLGQSTALENDFHLFVKTLEKNKIKTSFSERAGMWVLLQGMAHPQQASLSARMTYLIRRKDHVKQYLDVTAVDDDSNAFPVIQAVEILLKENQPARDIKFLASLIDLYFPKTVLVEKSLQNFVEQNKKTLRLETKLKPHYFRGKQTIKQDETITLSPMLRFISKYQKIKNRSELYQYDRTLHNYKSPRIDSKIYCNYDLNLYQHGVYLISPTVITALPIAYQEGDNLFLGSISQDTSSFSALGLGHQLRGKSKMGLRPALCFLDYKDFEMSILSNKDRDPAQLIFALLEKTSLSFTPSTIAPSLEQGRRLTLLNPLRAVVESDIISEKEIDLLNQQKISTYHYSPIGNIEIVFKDQFGHVTFFADGRNTNQILCPKEIKNEIKTQEKGGK